MKGEAREQSQDDADISYAQYRALANSIPNLAWMADPDGWIFWYNQRWYDYTGTKPDEMKGWGWQAVHHPDVLPGMLERWTTALRTGEPFEMTFPLRRGSDGSYRTFVTRAEPLREEGRIVGWFGTNTDITDQEQTRERLQLVINELNHRVKNTLATVHSMAIGTFKGGDPRALRSFETRLIALSGVHDLLTRESWASTLVRDVLDSALNVFDTSRFEILDCDLSVPPSVASALAMTLHELVTNAAKYGALSNATGKVSIVCRVEEGDKHAVLHIAWTERGGPPVRPPDRDGFGLRLIKRVLASEKGANVTLEFEPAGLVCSLTVPVPTSRTA